MPTRQEARCSVGCMFTHEPHEKRKGKNKVKALAQRERRSGGGRAASIQKDSVLMFMFSFERTFVSYFEVHFINFSEQSFQFLWFYKINKHGNNTSEDGTTVCSFKRNF